MKKFMLLAAFAAIGLPALPAHAATLDVTLGPSLSYSSGGSALTPNIDLATYSGLTLINAAVLPSNTGPGAFVMPSGPLSNNNFLAVYGPDQSHPFGTNGLATFNLSGGAGEFGFTWGTIDRYNKLTLTDSANNTFVITGGDILNHIAGSHNGSTQEDVVFKDPFGSIVAAMLTSTRNAFEAANFGTSVVPLPPALIVFGAGLLGFVMLGRLRKRQSI